ncbi:hypothetical protein [Blastococcus sp. TF02A-26]|uniref:hypothetical protein n=1 Tax=Blastococcus sp. TF02A-26 TaxID=2250577 RepID=UPI000DEB56D8|nr:hypothetical protein [Blastococcus sp. TF02A-26]RBY86109.1 hypothetical protein DQ240_09850 [Blastococcus sp. TF02A-26]
MSYDEVRVDPAVAAGGVLAWQAAAEALQARVREATSAIESAHGTQPWGGDSAGEQFSGAYLESAPTVAQGVPATADQLVELGDGVELAIQRSLDSDAEQAAEVTVEVESGL